MYDTPLPARARRLLPRGRGDLQLVRARSPVNRQTRLIGEILWGLGGFGTLALGIWLALYLDEYADLGRLIIAAIVLWLAATGVDSR